eukprot:g5345.t1
MLRMTKGLWLAAATVIAAPRRQGNFIEPPPAGMDEIGNVLLNQLTGDAAYQRAKVVAPGKRSEHERAEITDRNTRIGQHAEEAEYLESRDDLFLRFAEVLESKPGIKKGVDAVLALKDHDRGRGMVTSGPGDVDALPPGYWLEFSVDVPTKSHSQKLRKVTQAALFLSKLRSAAHVGGWYYQTAHSKKVAQLLQKFFQAALPWEAKNIRAFQSAVSLKTKLVLFVLRYELLKGLSFDCDGTLINSMEWYWYTWDTGMREKHYKSTQEEEQYRVHLPKKDIFTYDSFMRVYGGQSPQLILSTLVDKEGGRAGTEAAVEEKKARIGRRNGVDIKNRQVAVFGREHSDLFGNRGPVGNSQGKGLTFGTRPAEIPVVTAIARWIDAQYNKYGNLDIKLAVASSAEGHSLQKHLGHIGLLKHLDVIVGIKPDQKNVLEVFFPLDRFPISFRDIPGAEPANKRRKLLMRAAQSSPRHVDLARASVTEIEAYFNLGKLFNVERPFSRVKNAHFEGWHFELARPTEVSKPSRELFYAAGKLMGFEDAKQLIGFEDAQNGIESLKRAHYPVVIDVTDFKLHPDVRAFVFHLAKQASPGSDNRTLMLSKQTGALLNVVYELIVAYDHFHLFALVSDFDEEHTLAELAKFDQDPVKGHKLRNRWGETVKFADFFHRMHFAGALSMPRDNDGFVEVCLDDHRRAAATIAPQNLHIAEHSPAWHVGTDKAVAFVETDTAVELANRAGYKRVIDVRLDQRYAELHHEVTAAAPHTACASGRSSGTASKQERNGVSKLLQDLKEERDGQRSVETKNAVGYVFDMDGTVIDSMPYYYKFMQPVLQRNGFKYPTEAEFLRDLAGMTPLDIYKKVIFVNQKMNGGLVAASSDRTSSQSEEGNHQPAEIATAESLMQQEVEEKEKAKKTRMEAVQGNDGYIPPEPLPQLIPSVAGLVAKLGASRTQPSDHVPGSTKLKHKLAIATSSGMAKAAEYLQKLNLWDHFDVVVAGDDPEAAYRVGQLQLALDKLHAASTSKAVGEVAEKPPTVTAMMKKRILSQLAAERLDLSEKQCVAFEDAVVGLEAAAKAGYGKVIDVRNDVEYPHFGVFRNGFRAEYEGLGKKLATSGLKMKTVLGDMIDVKRKRVQELQAGWWCFFLDGQM